MKRLITHEQLYDAFERAELGSADQYSSWTALWALRSDIWGSKGMQKDARKALGTIAKSAIEEGTPQLFHQLGDALEAMMESERSPEYALRADVFFALEELNSSGVRFSRSDLFRWLNKQLDAAIAKEELHRVLALMGLADVFPRRK